MVAPHESWLQAGVAAARAGRAEEARTLLLRVVEAGEDNVQAWYWLSRVVESPREREVCLENVLALDPAHTAVQAELAELRRQMAEAAFPSSPPQVGGIRGGKEAVPRTAEEQLISDAAVEPLDCPCCGTQTEVADRQCPACARNLYVRQPKSEGHSIYSLGLVVVWLGLANLVWLGLFVYYLLSGFGGAGRTLAVLRAFLGMESTGTALLDLGLGPVLLAGGAIFGLSLIVAWGLYRRLRFFYWLTVTLMLSIFLAQVYHVAAAVAAAEAISVIRLVAQGGLFLLAMGFAFMAYDEFTWVEWRLDASVDRDVASHSALYARGRQHADRGMWAKAAAHWSRAVALSPGHPEYRIALASAYVNLEQPQQALEHLHVAQQIEPDNPRLRELLGSLES